MYAIVKTGGKQYQAVSDETIIIEKLEGDPGTKVELTEVVLVNDGSTDRSLAEALAFPSDKAQVRILDLSRTFGLDRALFTGLECATGELMVLADAKSPNSLDSLDALYSTLRDAAADLASGPTDTIHLMTRRFALAVLALPRLEKAHGDARPFLACSRTKLPGHGLRARQFLRAPRLRHRARVRAGDCVGVALEPRGLQGGRRHGRRVGTGNPGARGHCATAGLGWLVAGRSDRPRGKGRLQPAARAQGQQPGLVAERKPVSLSSSTRQS